MKESLFRITYVEDLNPENAQEVYILCKGFPANRQILKRINMIDYCGHEMTDEDYKEFVIKLRNYTKYNIESVDRVDYIKFEN